jgi:hypothetical protein
MESREGFILDQTHRHLDESYLAFLDVDWLGIPTVYVHSFRSVKKKKLYANRYGADNVFLPTYLSSRGAAFGTPSPYITWRNYTLVNFSGIWGPVLAGYMCGTRLGRKYTMVIGALVTMAFFFAYTQVRTATQNVSQRNQFSRSATQDLVILSE